MREGFEGGKDSVEEVLAALGRVAAPEGLEERVLLGVERRVVDLDRLGARGVEFRWRDVLLGPAAGIWWRGVASGAAVAMLAVGVVMLAGHLLHGRSGQVPDGVMRQRVVAVRQSGVSDPVVASVVPCAGAVRVREVAVAGVRPANTGRVEMGKVESPRRFETAAAAPLTAEERELVRLARRGDARELEALNPEARAKAEAEEAAQFQSFFAPPPPLPVDEAPAGPAGNNE